ncbi:MAG: Rne/Rng family ribonuclease [Phycisphaerales bacterium]
MSPESKSATKTQMLINYVPGEECRVAVVEDGKLEELHAERASNISRVGNIYVGVVTNVEPAIQAAFVDFGVEHHGFLHVTDIHPRYFPGEDEDTTTERVGRKTPRRERPPIQKCFRRGDEVVVQVLKEGVGTKGPTLTSYLSIPGRFLVMMPQMDKVGVSRKVEDEDQRRAMRQVLDQLELPEGFGFIVRTAGMDRNKTELKRDLAYLQRLWKDMEARHKTGRKARLLYSESDLLVRALRDMLGPEIEEVVIDNELALARAARFLKIVAPRSKTRLLQYEGGAPLFHAFGVEPQIAMMHAREVPLPSGGRLVIDETEALVAIDVNSGKMRDARDAETNAYRTNVEAVEEICRQLKLRDLGGIVINDLIDMRHASHRKDIEQRFRDRLKRDRARSTTLAISEFGILEMTRQRMRGSHESVHFVDCPTCRGRGMVQKPDSIASDALRNLSATLDHESVARVEMVVAPRVASELLSGRRKSLSQIERRTGKHVDVRVSETVPVDRITFYAYDATGADINVEALPRSKAPANLKVWELNIKGEEEWAVDTQGEETPAEPELSESEQAELAEIPAHPIEMDVGTPDGAPMTPLDESQRGGRRRRRRGRGGRGEPDGRPRQDQPAQRPARPAQPQQRASQPAADHGRAAPPPPQPGAATAPGAPGAAGEPGEGGRRRRRRRRRGRGGRDENGLQAGAPGDPGQPPADHEGHPEQPPQHLPALPLDDTTPRGDSWDVEPAAIQPLSARPVLRAVPADAPDEPDEAGPASADGTPAPSDNGAPEGEGGRHRRRRRRRGGRGGQGDAQGAPDSPQPPAGAPAPQPAAAHAPRPPARPAPPAPAPARASQPPPRPRPPQPADTRPLRVGGGYQRKPDAPAADGPAPAPAAPAPAPRQPAPVPVAAEPKGAPAAEGGVRRFLYSMRRKLAPGEIKKLPRE